MFTVALILISISAPVLALDWNGYLENTAAINNEEEFLGVNKFKLDLKEKKDQYLMMVSADVINRYGMATGTEYELNRAFLDLYPAWGSITIGKQRIAWGGSYFFNLADLFNPVNLLDPKGELAGIDGISVKWSLTDTAQAEGVVLPLTKVSDSDYGVKFKYTAGLFDLTAGSLKKTNLNAAVLERQSQVFEVKGEFSNTWPGFWFQYAFNSDKTAAGKEDYQSYVLGFDYTFNIGSGLYLLGEYLHDGFSDEDQYYFNTEYNFRDYLTLKVSGYYLNATEASFYSASLEYQLNDNIELSGTYYAYPEGSSKLGEMVNYSQDIKNAIEFKLKTTF